MSGKSEVQFASVCMKRMKREFGLVEKFSRMLDRLDLARVVKDQRVAIKMHLGGGTCTTTVHPVFVRQLVSKVREAGGHPFVTHSWGAMNSFERGYSTETLGCPVIPHSGSRERYHYTHETNHPYLPEVKIAGEIEDAQALVCLTHGKGHGNTGFGGALKNMGIGTLVGESRGAIHQMAAHIKYWDKDKCKPCRVCFDACPAEALHWSGTNKDELHVGFDQCNYCLKCQEVCPENALDIDGPGLYGSFQEGMVLAARESLSTFESGRRLFITFLTDITPWCDCHGYTMTSIIRDIGILGSRDIVAVEQAALELLDKEPIFTDRLPEPFELGSEGHLFQRFMGVVKDPYRQVEEAVKLGLGSREYELIEVE